MHSCLLEGCTHLGLAYRRSWPLNPVITFKNVHVETFRYTVCAAPVDIYNIENRASCTTRLARSRSPMICPYTMYVHIHTQKYKQVNTADGCYFFQMLPKWPSARMVRVIIQGPSTGCSVKDPSANCGITANALESCPRGQNFQVFPFTAVCKLIVLLCCKYQGTHVLL